MNSILQKMTPSEFTVTLLITFTLLVAGKCFCQTPPPSGISAYTMTVQLEPGKSLYSLHLEVATEAEVALSLVDAHGAPLADLLKKTWLHSGVYAFDLGQWITPGSVYFLKTGDGKMLRFELPGMDKTTPASKANYTLQPEYR